MKRLATIICLSSCALFTVHNMACEPNLSPMEGETKTFTALLTEKTICDCHRSGGELDCMDCYSPCIIVNDKTYFINKLSEQKMKDMGLQTGQEIEVTGVLFDKDCVDYIDPVSIKKLQSAVDLIESFPTILDTQQPMYNSLGQPVDAAYQGLVIQNGHKFLLD